MSTSWLSQERIQDASGYTLAPIYTPHMDSKGVVEGSEQHWERGKHVLSQDKDCLKAPH